MGWRTGLELGAAREKVRVARALGELPRLAAAMERGELSFSKVRALTGASPASPELEARHGEGTRRLERLLAAEWAVVVGGSAGTPAWEGERVDYGMVIEYFHRKG